MLWQGHVGLGCRILGFPIHLGSVLTLCELLVWVSGQPEMLLPKARERGDLEMCPWKIIAVDEQDPCAWQRHGKRNVVFEVDARTQLGSETADFQW